MIKLFPIHTEVANDPMQAAKTNIASNVSYLLN